jgi:glutaredoxin
MSAESNSPAGDLVVYGRPGCHVCDEALALLRPLARELGLTLSEVDIESDDDLLRAYLEAIPVIRLAGTELGRLDDFRAPDFERRLRDFVRNGY